MVHNIDVRDDVGSTFIEGRGAAGGGHRRNRLVVEGVAGSVGVGDSEGDFRSSVHRGRHLDFRHEGLLDDGSVLAFTEVTALVDVTHDVIREQVALEVAGNLAGEGRGGEGNELAGDSEFTEGAGRVADDAGIVHGSTANLGLHDSLHGGEHVLVDDVLLDGAGELEALGLQDFLAEVLEVTEIFPHVGFDRGILVGHRGGELHLSDGIGVGDDAVGDSTRVSEVGVHLCTKLLALQFRLREFLLGCADVRHVVTDSRGKKVELLAVSKSVRCDCHCKLLLMIMADWFLPVKWQLLLPARTESYAG